MSRTQAFSVPQTLSGKILTNEFMGDVWDNQSAMKQSITLTASTDFIAIESVDVGSASTLEIPSTSSLEIITYSPYSLLNNDAGGWVPAGTWTFVSSTTMLVPIADAVNMSVGTKLKLFQTAQSYFYVTAISTNLVTLTGGSDYTLANATINSPFYSNASSPVGFPQWFNYTESWTGFSANPSGGVSRFKIEGRLVTFNIERATAGTSNATSTTITIPVTATSLANYAAIGTLGITQDASALPTTPGVWQVSASATTVSAFLNNSRAGWTATGTKNAQGYIIYEI